MSATVIFTDNFKSAYIPIYRTKIRIILTIFRNTIMTDWRGVFLKQINTKNIDIGKQQEIYIYFQNV